MAITIFFMLLAVTLAFMGSGVPFLSHCFDFIFVSGVCMETADSSMVIIFSRKLFSLSWIF